MGFRTATDRFGHFGILCCQSVEQAKQYNEEQREGAATRGKEF